MKVNLRCIIAGLLVALIGMVQGAAAAYPDRPIRIIVPFPPGGVTDILARTIGSKLSEQLGQPVVIDNRGGAGGTIGTAVAAKSTPDGYTLVLGTQGTHVVNYALVDKLPYHPLKDFAPVIPVAAVPSVLVVPASVPYLTFAELIAAARAKPGTLSHASSGIGASPSLCLSLLKTMAKVDIIEVMYKGSGPVVADLIAGHVTMAFDSVASSIPHIKSGRLRPLAVTSSRRVKALPDVPAIAEQGYPGFDVVAWLAIWAPAATPLEIVRKLNAEIDAILKLPDVVERLNAIGAEILGGSVDEFAVFHQSEFDRWTTLLKNAGVKAQ